MSYNQFPLVYTRQGNFLPCRTFLTEDATAPQCPSGLQFPHHKHLQSLQLAASTGIVGKPDD
ncbi:hypothetical protein CSM15_005045 [Salmonella enterica subsp. diarizonae]|nr:hypothetical protein [Salmonella enterica subsp. diarizonae]EGV2901751.1 hypothetical protein [Salmonella enterica]EIE7938901.1 hypothetical protein [Salmonella enterica]